VEETGVHGENHQPAVSHWQTLSHDVVSSTPHQKKDTRTNTDLQNTTQKIKDRAIWPTKNRGNSFPDSDPENVNTL
jgi:hypothetical protein